MENQEEIHDVLTLFEKKPSIDIPPVLEDYLKTVAKTGRTFFPWSRIKILFVNKVEQVMEQFNSDVPYDHLPPFPNVENSKYNDMQKRIVEAMHRFAEAPFTVQRICELVTQPRKHYTRCDKFLRGIEKNVMVVSTVDPFGRRIVSESSRLMVNGLDTNGFGQKPDLNEFNEGQPFGPIIHAGWASNNNATSMWPTAGMLDNVDSLQKLSATVENAGANLTTNSPLGLQPSSENSTNSEKFVEGTAATNESPKSLASSSQFEDDQVNCSVGLAPLARPQGLGPPLEETRPPPVGSDVSEECMEKEDSEESASVEVSQEAAGKSKKETEVDSEVNTEVDREVNTEVDREVNTEMDSEVNTVVTEEKEVASDQDPVSRDTDCDEPPEKKMRLDDEAVNSTSELPGEDEVEERQSEPQSARSPSPELPTVEPQSARSPSPELPTEGSQSAKSPSPELHTVEPQSAKSPSPELPTERPQSAKSPSPELQTVESQSAKSPSPDLPTEEPQSAKSPSPEPPTEEPQSSCDDDQQTVSESSSGCVDCVQESVDSEDQVSQSDVTADPTSVTESTVDDTKTDISEDQSVVSSTEDSNSNQSQETTDSGADTDQKDDSSEVETESESATQQEVTDTEDMKETEDTKETQEELASEENEVSASSEVSVKDSETSMEEKEATEEEGECSSAGEMMETDAVAEEERKEEQTESCAQSTTEETEGTEPMEQE